MRRTAAAIVAVGVLMVGCGGDDEPQVDRSEACRSAWRAAARDGERGNPDDLRPVIEACQTTRIYVESASRVRTATHAAVVKSPLDDAEVLCQRGEAPELFCDDIELLLND